MNTKLNKLLKLAAAGLFLIALAVNVKVTLDDPFVMLSEQAIATATGTGTGTGGTGGSGSQEMAYIRTPYPAVDNVTMEWSNEEGEECSWVCDMSAFVLCTGTGSIPCTETQPIESNCSEAVCE